MWTWVWFYCLTPKPNDGLLWFRALLAERNPLLLTHHAQATNAVSRQSHWLFVLPTPFHPYLSFLQTTGRKFVLQLCFTNSHQDFLINFVTWNRLMFLPWLWILKAEPELAFVCVCVILWYISLTATYLLKVLISVVEVLIEYVALMNLWKSRLYWKTCSYQLDRLDCPGNPAKYPNFNLRTIVKMTLGSQADICSKEEIDREHEDVMALSHWISMPMSTNTMHCKFSEVFCIPVE